MLSDFLKDENCVLKEKESIFRQSPLLIPILLNVERKPY